MSPTGSFDLLSRRKPGWKPETALVVSPYVEAEFFLRLARDLRPKRIHVVIDDGCRREDREAVIKALAEGGHKRQPLLRLGSARGLVHMKLFYVRWTTPGGRAAYSLVFGSANATRQGFSGVDNAELVAGCTLTAKSHADVIGWCDRVIAATRTAEIIKVAAAHSATLAKGMRLRLPEITIGREVAAVSNFDLWIQRGSLLSTYRPDPSFLRVAIPLAKPLSRGEQASLAVTAGFEVPQTKSVRHRYIDDGSRLGEFGEEVEIHDTGNWRRRLFTWTHLGEWCSDECYVAHRSRFRRRNHERRQAALGQLRALADSSTRAFARDSFLVKMDRLWSVFGENAPDILRGKGEVDHRHYGKIFDGRVERDLELIEDEEFERRYVDGFEFVPVPRFRDDVVGWRHFVDSLGRQLALDETRGRSQSQLLSAIREVIQASDEDEVTLQDPRSLIAFLREIWRENAGRSVGPAASIARYYER